VLTEPWFGAMYEEVIAARAAVLGGRSYSGIGGDSKACIAVIGAVIRSATVTEIETLVGTQERQGIHLALLTALFVTVQHDHEAGSSDPMEQLCHESGTTVVREICSNDVDEESDEHDQEEDDEAAGSMTWCLCLSR
jgi:hypothetical protein